MGTNFIKCFLYTCRNHSLIFSLTWYRAIQQVVSQLFLLLLLLLLLQNLITVNKFLLCILGISPIWTVSYFLNTPLNLTVRLGWITQLSFSVAVGSGLNSSLRLCWPQTLPKMCILLLESKFLLYSFHFNLLIVLFSCVIVCQSVHVRNFYDGEIFSLIKCYHCCLMACYLNSTDINFATVHN